VGDGLGVGWGEEGMEEIFDLLPVPITSIPITSPVKRQIYSLTRTHTYSMGIS
jgi:hypothetical protein